MRSLPILALACTIGVVSCDLTGPDPEPAIRLSPLRAEDHVVEVGEPVTLSVRAIGDRGRAVAGVTVLWTIEAGGGTVVPPSVQTSEDGVASTQLRAALGENRVMAKVQGSSVATILIAHGCSRCGEWSFVPVDLAAGGRAWAGAASVGGRIWVFGGERWPDPTDAIDVFDPADTTWRQGARLDVPLMASTAVALGGRLYVIGGLDPEVYPWRGTTGVGAFDPSTGQWTQSTRLADRRFFAASAVLDERIYVMGGLAQCDMDFGCTGPVAGLEIYDPATDRWTTGPGMLFPRTGAGAAALEGKLYVAGGTISDQYWLLGPVATVEMFDPVAGRWSRKADLPTAGPAQLAVMDGTLYAIVSNRELRSARTYAYDPQRDAWLRLRDAPDLLYGAAIAVVGGGLYAVGGYSNVTDVPFRRQISDAIYVMRR